MVQAELLLQCTTLRAKQDDQVWTNNTNLYILPKKNPTLITNTLFDDNTLTVGHYCICLIMFHFMPLHLLN